MPEIPTTLEQQAEQVCKDLALSHEGEPDESLFEATWQHCSCMALEYVHIAPGHDLRVDSIVSQTKAQKRVRSAVKQSDGSAIPKAKAKAKGRPKSKAASQAKSKGRKTKPKAAASKQNNDDEDDDDASDTDEGNDARGSAGDKRAQSKPADAEPKPKRARKTALAKKQRCKDAPRHASQVYFGLGRVAHCACVVSF